MNTKTNLQRFQARASESGQALVLIAALIVILLAALGLAIDGGGMFLLWRDAQNAVDAASLQAAFAYCTNNEDLASAQTAGYTAANMNGFNNDTLDNWVTVDRATNLVPASQLPANAVKKNDIIMVRIRAVKPSYFIQLVYGGPMEVNVSSLGVCNAGGNNIFDGYSVYSLGSNGICGGNGYTEADFTGSEAHFFSPIASNGDLRVNGGNDNLHFHDQAGVQYVGDIAGTDKMVNYPANNQPVTGTGSATVETPYSSFPTLYTWSQFDYGGEIWEAIDALNGVSGDYQNDTNLRRYNGNTTIDFPIDGLVVVNGSVTFKKGFQVGSDGITVVATGSISSGADVNDKNNPTHWFPYTNSTGMTNGLLFFSAYAPNGNPPTDCDTGHGGAAASFTASGILAEGIIYAPYGLVSWSGSTSFYCGSIIALTYTSSGSDKWFFTKSIPTDAAMIQAGLNNNAQWFLDAPFEGKNCDFISSSSSNIFLGDLNN